jgi:tRNA-dihydrouridine synthase B
MERHWDLAESLYGPERTGPLLRKFGIKYTGCHPEHRLVREDFTAIRGRDDWFAVLDRWYSQDGPGVYPSPELHRVQGSGGCGVQEGD